MFGTLVIEIYRVWSLALPDCCHVRLSLRLGFKFRVLLVIVHHMGGGALDVSKFENYFQLMRRLHRISGGLVVLLYD